jgi:hypothetical protein
MKERDWAGPMAATEIALVQIEETTLEQLREKFRVCWVRGSEWRFEVGELLHQIKKRCEHGEWGAFLDEFGLARSTADDYIRRYRDEADITVPRQFNEAEPDPEAEERKRQIEEEKKKREGKKPTHHATQLHVRIKDLTPDQLALYRAERKENPDRVKDIWMRAFLSVIGEEYRGLPEPEEEQEREEENEPAPVEEEGVQC